jgi:hypothetical protein
MAHLTREHSQVGECQGPCVVVAECALLHDTHVGPMSTWVTPVGAIAGSKRMVPCC